jgi:hypothetical protein
MSAKKFLRLARRKKLDIHQCFYQPTSDGRMISINSLQTEKTYTASSTPLDTRGIPTKYNSYQDVFHNKSEPNRPLAPHRKYDLSIEFDEDADLPPPGKIYPLNPEQSDALLAHIEKSLAHGWIRPSKSQLAAPCFFVKKPNGELRLCIDYRALNNITKKNRYPIPLISEIIDELRKAKIYTRLDLPDAYHLVRIKEGDEWKTAFRCKFGHYEYNVIPFGLSNAPAAFQTFMNEIFADLLNKFTIVYLDDILIYSNDPKEHDEHVKIVLERLRKHGLCVNPKKCSFDVHSIDFLGYIISPDGISMDPAKTQIIEDWIAPQSVKDVQTFLGFANYYRRFIYEFAKVTKPLTSLLKKNKAFCWTNDAEKSFQELKQRFTSAPILRFFDFSKETILETDASDFAIAGILSQVNDDGLIHPTAFHSRTLNSAEINYDTHDKELLAIVDSIRLWSHYLLPITPEQPFTIYSDHKNLVNFTKTLKLTRRQYRWMETLSDFNFVITHRAGKLNGKADALSRRSQHQREVDERPNPNITTIFGTNQDGNLYLQHPITVNAIGTLQDTDTDLVSQIRTALKDSTILKNYLDKKLPKQYTFEDDLLLYENLVVVPTANLQLEVMLDSHSTLATGHFGVNKTLELIQRNFYWPGMRRSIQKLIKGCDTCSRAKADRSKPYGLLHPLPIPEGRWTDLSIDFITDLPPSGTDKYDQICVVKCRLTKQAHFIPTFKTIDAQGTATLFLQYIFRHHGFPNSITSDRGPQFIAMFWERFLELMNCKRNLTSAYHPESNSSAEVTNQVIEQFLRIHCNYEQNNWYDLLPLAEFTYNNSLNSTINMTPFYANQGYNPQFSTRIFTSSTVPAAEQRVQQVDADLAELKTTLQRSQESYTAYANKERQPHNFQIGDLVFLNRKNIKTTRPARKLDDKFFGPFKIIQRINDVAFKLKLPASLKIHPVFHVSLFKPKDPDNIEVPSEPPPAPITIDDHEEFEVELILDSKKIRNTVKYLVHWKGYDKQARSWEPYSCLTNCLDLLLDYHRRNPLKPQCSEILGQNL